MLNALTLNRRRWMQAVGGGLASSALGALPVRADLARDKITPDKITPDKITAAVVQSRAQNVADLTRELAQVQSASRKDLVCFPALEGDVGDAGLRALAYEAQRSGAYVSINDSLITPHGEIHAGQGVYDTELGAIAFVPSLFKPVKIEGAEILLHLSAQPVSFARAQTLATDHRAHLLAATPVGDAFLQASGSVIFAPSGEVLAAAGAAWTQTLTATLRVAHWRDVQANV